VSQAVGRLSIGVGCEPCRSRGPAAISDRLATGWRRRSGPRSPSLTAPRQHTSTDISTHARRRERGQKKGRATVIPVRFSRCWSLCATSVHLHPPLGGRRRGPVRLCACPRGLSFTHLLLFVILLSSHVFAALTSAGRRRGGRRNRRCCRPASFSACLGSATHHWEHQWPAQRATCLAHRTTAGGGTRRRRRWWWQ
jgi:hypothetical protein